MSMRRLAPALAALSLLLGSCGGGDAQEALTDTAANLGKIRSGELTLELSFQARGTGKTGFTLDGPFSLEKGPLVAGRLDYTQLLGAQGSQTATFVSTGQKAFVVVQGQPYELPPELVSQLQAASTQLTASGLSSLDVGRWFEDPELEDGGEVGGADTDLIRARLNVIAAVNTLLAVSSQLRGEGATPLSGDDEAQLQRAVKSASAEIWTGKDDRLLRKLDIAIDFNPQTAPERIRRVIGVTVHFVLAVSNPNEDVSVEAPAHALPYSELGSG
jgi:hypothetical protein